MLFSLFPVPGGLTAPLRAELLAGFAIAGPLGAPSQAHAQAAWPTKPMAVISPFATGGSVDVLTRIVATYMSQSLGQPMVIDTLASRLMATPPCPAKIIKRCSSVDEGWPSTVTSRRALTRLRALRSC